MIGFAVPVLVAGFLVPAAGIDVGSRAFERWRLTLVRTIHRNIDRGAGDAPSGEKICAEVRFIVLSSGRIVLVGLASSSGSPAWDEAALDGIRRSSPVRPLPDGRSHPFSVPLCYAG